MEEGGGSGILPPFANPQPNFNTFLHQCESTCCREGIQPETDITGGQGRVPVPVGLPPSPRALCWFGAVSNST